MSVNGHMPVVQCDRVCVLSKLANIAVCSFYSSDLKFHVRKTARTDVHYSKAVRDQVIINRRPKFMSSFCPLSDPHA